MIIGVNLPNYSRLGTRDSILAIAQAAEALGYASLWTNDHVLLPTRIDSIRVALASTTSRLQWTTLSHCTSSSSNWTLEGFATTECRTTR